MQDRLKEYRERLGFTQSQVAQQLKIPRETLSTWENGKRRPHPNHLQKLAKIYQVSTAYLMGEEDLAEDQEREVLYRGIPGNGKVRSQIDGWLDFLDEWAEFLHSLGLDPEGFRTPKKLDRGLVEDIRRASTLAVEVREHYDLGLDAIADIFTFLDDIRVLVYRAALGSYREMGENQISGACFNHPQLGCCILVNSDTTPGRQAFTLAHEFAHALYHYSAKGITSVSGQSSEPKERFANAFAAHFLVPNKSLRHLIKEKEIIHHMTPYRVVQLAAHFRVSYATMLMRLAEDRMISFEKRSEWKGYSPRSMASQLGLDTEPFEIPDSFFVDPIDRYPLSVLEQIKTALENKQVSQTKAAKLLRVKKEDLSRRLLSTPSQATEGEILEFDEMPY